MSLEIRNKLNLLLASWPYGIIMTSQELVKKGYSPQLLKKYINMKWLRRVGQGAYAKLNDHVTWQGALFALQKQLELPVHVGGLSALEIRGLAHFIQRNEETRVFHLYNTTFQKRALPKWFNQMEMLLCHYYQYHLFEHEIGLEVEKMHGIDVLISSPERAILEILALVPQKFDYKHAYLLSENLQLLRPTVMQPLLENCLSYKVNRLFLYMANKHQLPCFSHLDFAKIPIGKGKRTIQAGGHYIAEYQLVVPLIDEPENGTDHV